MTGLRITSTGPRSTRIEVDGVDISHTCSGITIWIDTLGGTVACLDMRVESIDIDDPEATVEYGGALPPPPPAMAVGRPPKPATRTTPPPDPGVPMALGDGFGWTLLGLLAVALFGAGLALLILR